MELLGAEAGGEEVAIVHEDVANARVGEVGGEIGLPDALGEPEAGGLDAEPRADGLPHPLDLLHPVAPGERGEHRFVEAAEEDFHLSVGGEPAQPVEVCGLVSLEPLEEGAGQVQNDREEPAIGEGVEQRPVDVLDVLREDVVEVADRLVEVKPEGEADRRHRQPRAIEREPPSAAATAGITSGKRWSRLASTSARRCAGPRASSLPSSSAATSASASEQCSSKRRSA